MDGCMKFNSTLNIGIQGDPGKDADIAAAEAATEAANNAAIKAAQDMAAFIEQKDAEFDEAQIDRSGIFAANMDRWNTRVQTAAGNADASSEAAENAAQAANNAADSLAQRVANGEFNGAAFSIKFTPNSISAMNALTSMKKGDFACIQSNVEDPDNSKLFLYNGVAWSFITDLSGAIGIKGDQGVQGVSLKSVQVVDTTKVEVTQHDPSTQQDRTYIIGDFAAPLAAGIQAYSDRKFQVVTEYPAAPVEGVVYMEVM